MSKIAFIFPGQGSQYVGMGKSLYDNFPESKEIYDIADDVLGFKLSKLSFEGPLDELTLTKNAQVAILTHSIAVYVLLKKKGIVHSMSAGHSLGEYSALVSADAISFESALKVVRVRGELMYESGVKKPGTMAAIMGLDDSKIEEICKSASDVGIVQIANYNCPGQIVISGEVSAVLKAMELAKSAGAKIVKQLQVSGAFHSALMEYAIEGLTQALDKITINPASVPVFCNVNSQPVTDPTEIKKNLINQLANPVRWTESIQQMIKSGGDTFIEVGPGTVLKGLMKRINPNVKALNVDKAEDLSQIQI